MNKESLKNLPLLIECLDENLAININDFISHELFKEYSLNILNIQDIVKQSKKFHFDNKTKMIRFRDKPDRNIIILNLEKFLKEESSKLNSEEILSIDKIEFIKEYFLKDDKNITKNIKNFQEAYGNILILLENEESALELEKIFQQKIKIVCKLIKFFFLIAI